MEKEKCECGHEFETSEKVCPDCEKVNPAYAGEVTSDIEIQTTIEKQTGNLDDH